MGFRARISFQHDDAFTVEQGLFINGIADEKNLVDMNIGYKFSEKFALDLSGNNVFDQKYRAIAWTSCNWKTNSCKSNV